VVRGGGGVRLFRAASGFLAELFPALAVLRAIYSQSLLLKWVPLCTFPGWCREPLGIDSGALR
jgi:hypothetical protein